MSETITLLPDVQSLAAAVAANSAETTPQAMLADELQDNGVGAAAAEKLAKAVVETAGDPAAAARLVEARAMVEGTVTERLVSTYRTVRRRDRKSARVRGNLCRIAGATGRRGRVISCTRVEVVAGDAAPSYEGSGWYYTTTTGVVVRHPNAYRRVAKSARLVYHAAQHVVTVGADWVLAHAAELTA